MPRDRLPLHQAEGTLTRYVIRAGGVVDATGADPKRDHAVLVEDDKISAIGPIDKIKADGAEVIELGDCTILPGLMDLHVHLHAQNQRTYNQFRAATFEVTPQLNMLHALAHAQLTMEAGFTTLRDLGWIAAHGSVVKEAVALREAINARFVPGPRLIIGAFTTTTNSHLEMTLPGGYPRRDGYTYTGDGPWELRKLAREYIRAGADVIKCISSGGTGADEDVDKPNLNMTQEELDAAIGEATTFGKRAAVHCYTGETQIMAMKAGASTLEHCIRTSDAAMAMMKDKDVTLVPTLAKRTDEAIEIGSKAGRAPKFSDGMRQGQKLGRETFKKLHKAGVKLALGTDTTVEPYAGRNSQEMLEYVDLGMSPMEAILTGTRNAAAALGMSKTLGTLEVGKIADILAVRGDPTKDITLFMKPDNIRLVMKEGRVYVDKRPKHERSVLQERDRDWAVAF
jgi:imidazolonepropionase-like amidohydrolase